jgi:hypothetical protein
VVSSTHKSNKKRVKKFSLKSEERRPLGRPGVEVIIILKCILIKYSVRFLDLTSLRQSPVGGYCEQSNIILGPTKGGKFVSRLKNCRLSIPRRALLHEREWVSVTLNYRPEFKSRSKYSHFTGCAPFAI